MNDMLLIAPNIFWTNTATIFRLSKYKHFNFTPQYLEEHMQKANYLNKIPL